MLKLKLQYFGHLLQRADSLEKTLMLGKIEGRRRRGRQRIRWLDGIMASDPITSWQIEGEKVETVTDFIFLAPKSLLMVTAAIKLKDTCSLEGKL